MTKQKTATENPANPAAAAVTPAATPAVAPANAAPQSGGIIAGLRRLVGLGQEPVVEQPKEITLEAATAQANLGLDELAALLIENRTLITQAKTAATSAAQAATSPVVEPNKDAANDDALKSKAATKLK